MQLADALAQYEISIPPDQIAALERYCRLLWDWNEKINLTRHTDFEKFVSRDVIDSLALARHLSAGEDILDVGTGGGVPGIVIAILRPDVSVSLVESVAKKARVVEDIVSKLKLPLEVHHARAEELLVERFTCDTLVVRAVAPLAKLLTWFAPRWGAFQRLLVIKGPSWVDERREARERGLFNSLQLRKLETYVIPGTGAESVVLEIKPTDQA